MTTEKKMRYSDAELLLINKTFADNEKLLVILRKIFLKMPLVKTEVDIAKKSLGDEVRALLSKTFLPQISGDVPFGQNVDLWMIPNLDNKTQEEITRQLKTRDQFLRLIKDGLNRLGNPEIGVNDGITKFDIDRSDFVKSDIELAARNALINHTEFQLMQLMVLAGNKIETPEEIKKRLTQDSTK